MEFIGRYKIIREIGQGGMAKVFLAFDSILQRPVAIKIIHPHLTNDIKAIKRFQNEAHAVAKLSHENIIRLFDCGQQDNQQYLIMEYLEGKTLKNILEQYHILPNLVVMEIFVQILSGLAAAHEKGVYHRDIKPSNIMIDKYGTVKIMDFGIAYLVTEGSITLSGAFVGSPSYISPEQAQGMPISEKTDIFSTGILIYECCSGECPFNGDSVHAVILSIVQKEPRPIFSYNPKALFFLDDILNFCLQKKPLKRISANECLELIERQCNSDNLKLGKNRIVQFLQNPRKYAEQESSELQSIYRQLAYNNIKAKMKVKALKNFSQAKCFGALSPEDEKTLTLLEKRSPIRIITVTMMLLICVVAAVMLIWNSQRGASLIEAKKLFPKTKDTLEIIKSIKSEPFDSKSTLIGPGELKVGDSVSVKNGIEMLPAEKENTKKVVSHTTIVSSKHNNRPKKEGLAESSETVFDSKLKGYLILKSRPPDASVIIDGIAAGKTGETEVVVVLANKPHILEVVKDGHLPHREEIVVGAGDTLEKRILLQPIQPE